VNDDPDGEDDIIPTKAYNIDWLNKTARRGQLALLVMDNYKYRPAPSGMGRPEQTSDFIYDADREQRAPHRVLSNKRSINSFWCANYADGHVNMNLWNH
jgi:hypothetical protein